MKILVTGAAGMLARALIPELEDRGYGVIPLDRAQLDITDAAAVEARIADELPDVVVQCAAYTAVDAAESDVARAFAVNAEATAHVVRACQKIGARVVYPSTDYVFPGTARTPYQPADNPQPVNVYGRSKRAGELKVLEGGTGLVVRTSWLYGPGGANFVDTIRRLARERGRLEVVDDQIGRPTWTRALAVAITGLLERGAHGIYHAAGGGDPVSWYEFAREILTQDEIGVLVVAVPSDRFPRPAPRPAYSVLDCTATEELLGHRLPDWRRSLALHLREPATI